MIPSLIRCVVMIAALLPVLIAAAARSPEPGDCPNDTKLLGAVLLSSVDAADTWWGITRAGFEGAGIAPADFEATIEGFLGMSFPTLGAAVDALVDVVRPFDENGNGYVCAFSLRGRRAYLQDPQYTFYTFGVVDDKIKHSSE